MTRVSAWINLMTSHLLSLYDFNSYKSEKVTSELKETPTTFPRLLQAKHMSVPL